MGQWYVRVESTVPTPAGRHPGAFALLRALRRSGRLDGDDAALAAALVDRSYALHDEPPEEHFRTDPPAASWFRETGTPPTAALLHLMEDVVALLHRHGIRTRWVRCTDPGTITFVDDVQIAAIPYTGEDWPFS